MRRNVLMAGALALVLAVPAANAQGKPDFSGTWNRVTDPNAAPTGGRGGGRGGIGMTATITQDAKTLTITRTTQNGEVKTVYNLDGTDSKNTMTMGGNPVEQTSKAAWEGSKLVITTNYAMGENAITTKQEFTLDATGQLVVSVTAPGRGGGEPTTTVATYKKG